MNTREIIAGWKKSPHIPQLPTALNELLKLFSLDKVEKDFSDSLIKYIQDESDRLISILESPPFSLQLNSTSVDDLIEQVNPGLILNFLLINFFSKLKPIGVEDKIDYVIMKRENFISAFCARQLAMNYPEAEPDNLFSLSYFKDISLLMLSRANPDDFNEIIKKGALELSFSLDAIPKLSGKIDKLNAWILKNWGFNDTFILPLLSTQSEEPKIRVYQKIIKFSRVAARYLLDQERYIKYHQFEDLYREYFQKSPKDLQIFLIELIRSINKQAVFFDYFDLADLRIFGVLKEHIDLFDKNLLTYEDLVNEVIKANKHIVKQEKEIRLLRDRIEKSQVRDAITGLFNHTYLQEFLLQKIREAVRYEYPITLIIFDLDNFHHFNKYQGYAAGNEILRQLAELIKSNIRQSDVIARYGNDEFALVLPYTGPPHSRIVAEKISDLVLRNEFEDDINEKSHKITISIGYASVLPDKTFIDKDKLIPLAQMALDKAKENGGNRIKQAMS